MLRFLKPNNVSLANELLRSSPQNAIGYAGRQTFSVSSIRRILCARSFLPSWQSFIKSLAC